MPVPYTPPQQPPVIQQPADIYQDQIQKQDQDQNQKQDQNQNQIVNNNPAESNNANNLTNDVRSAPEAEIVQTQSSSLNSYQINSQQESAWVRFSNATQVPVPQVYFNMNYNRSAWGNVGDNNDNVNLQAGVTIPIGGGAKKLAYEEVEVNTLARTLSICNSLGYYEGKVDIDFEAAPHLADCASVSAKAVPAVVVEEPNSRLEEIRTLRQQLQDQLNRQRQLEETIIQINQRFTPRENGSTVKVGG